MDLLQEISVSRNTALPNGKLELNGTPLLEPNGKLESNDNPLSKTEPDWLAGREIFDLRELGTLERMKDYLFDGSELIIDVFGWSHPVYVRNGKTPFSDLRVGIMTPSLRVLIVSFWRLMPSDDNRGRRQ